MVCIFVMCAEKTWNIETWGRRTKKTELIRVVGFFSPFMWNTFFIQKSRVEYFGLCCHSHIFSHSFLSVDIEKGAGI